MFYFADNSINVDSTMCIFSQLFKQSLLSNCKVISIIDYNIEECIFLLHLLLLLLHIPIFCQCFEYSVDIIFLELGRNWNNSDADSHHYPNI